jgi:hypothetical protein
MRHSHRGLNEVIIHEADEKSSRLDEEVDHVTADHSTVDHVSVDMTVVGHRFNGDHDGPCFCVKPSAKTVMAASTLVLHASLEASQASQEPGVNQLVVR